MKGKKWVFPEEINTQKCSFLAERLDVPLIVASILLQRGIDEKETALKFLNPNLDDLHDPFLMKGMENGVARVVTALSNNERIMIFGDYDVDGVTSTALLLMTLSQLGGDILYYIPDRMSEGYGLSKEGIHEALRKKVSLIITVDCGTRAYEEIEYANQHDLDVIVTDHHQPGDDKGAYTILNPKQIDDQYPFKELCGVGVAFKLLCGILKAMNQSLKLAYDCLDIVALGTISDIVPLVGENRIIAHFGLQQVNQSPRCGLKALIDVAGLGERHLGSSEIVFNIAPRINAGGRLGDARRGVVLFLERDYHRALKIAESLDVENRKRQTIDERIFEDAKRMIEENIDLEEVKALVLASEEWHAGVIGIVASRLVETYHRPTVLISIDPETKIGKGSSRSIPTFHLYEALSQCSDLLDEFGGHQHAAGLSIQAEKIYALRERFNAVASHLLTEDDMIPRIHVAGEVELKDAITNNLYEILKKFSPFGPGNMRPVLVSRNLDVVGTPRIVGKNHLKFAVGQSDVTLDMIGFGFGTPQLVDELSYARPKIDIAYVLEENKWRGKTMLQGRLKDISINSSW